MAQVETTGRQPPLPTARTEGPGGPDDPFALALDWHRWWTIVPEIVALLCTGLLPVVVMANVIARYTDWFHVPWTEDVVKVLFLWIIFLGGAIAVKHDAHVRMAMLSDRMATRWRMGRLWMRVIRWSPMAMGLILLVLGVQVVEISVHRQLTALQVTSAYFMTIVPASGALMIIYGLAGLRTPKRGRAAATPVQE